MKHALTIQVEIDAGKLHVAIDAGGAAETIPPWTAGYMVGTAKAVLEDAACRMAESWERVDEQDGRRFLDGLHAAIEAGLSGGEHRAVIGIRSKEGPNP